MVCFEYRVLVVEDIPAEAEIAAYHLRAAGLACTGAEPTRASVLVLDVEQLSALNPRAQLERLAAHWPRPIASVRPRIGT